MGLTSSSTGKALAKKDKSYTADYKIALAGNPNVGKSTVFNQLTGLKQHTGNWAGKTVSAAEGVLKYKNKSYLIADIPGCYSLNAHSKEEEVARDYICFGGADCIVIVCDATCLHRNLLLVLQTLEITEKVILCVNLMDEAERHGIKINLKKLEQRLNIKVVPTTAKTKKGMEKLVEKIASGAKNKTLGAYKVSYDEKIEEAIGELENALEKENINTELSLRFIAIKLLENDTSFLKSLLNSSGYTVSDNINQTVDRINTYLNDNGLENLFSDYIARGLIDAADKLLEGVYESDKNNKADDFFDKILTHKFFGFVFMFFMLALVFYITISGANIPSMYLENFLLGNEDNIYNFLVGLGLNTMLADMLVHGMYRVVAWVVAVMLPPMAIFFPLFTMLEDLGFLPRIAFNLDRCFKWCDSCGKQALTMCMGFGCNSAGVVGCRIIDSPRERLIAIITNSFAPCNGRFPGMIAVITMFFCAGAGISGQIKSAFILSGFILLSILLTFASSCVLSKTFLKGVPTSFTIELPPIRKPQIGKILVRSVFDRVIFVLGRAIAVAAPAGIIIWLTANLSFGGNSVIDILSSMLNPVAFIMGLDGVILLAFILGMPANEIVIPIIIMTYMSTKGLVSMGDTESLKALLIANGWTVRTAICTLIFFVAHWPCSTTLITVYKETKSLKWTIASFLVPALMGAILCIIVNFGLSVIA